MKPEPKTIVLGRVSTLPPENVVSGSIHVQCDNCGSWCWMSPESNRITGVEDVAWCIECSMKEMKSLKDRGEEVHVKNVTEGQLQEIRRHFSARSRHTKED